MKRVLPVVGVVNEGIASFPYTVLDRHVQSKNSRIGSTCQQEFFLQILVTFMAVFVYDYVANCVIMCQNKWYSENIHVPLSLSHFISFSFQLCLLLKITFSSTCHNTRYLILINLPCDSSRDGLTPSRVISPPTSIAIRTVAGNSILTHRV